MSSAEQADTSAVIKSNRSILEAIYKFKKHIPEKHEKIVQVVKAGNISGEVIIGKNSKVSSLHWAEEEIESQWQNNIVLNKLQSLKCTPRTGLVLDADIPETGFFFNTTQSCLGLGLLPLVNSGFVAEMNVRLCSSDGYQASNFQVTNAYNGEQPISSSGPFPTTESELYPFLPQLNGFLNGTYTSSVFNVSEGVNYFGIIQLDPSTNPTDPRAVILANLTLSDQTVCTVPNSNFSVVTSPGISWTNISIGCAALGKVPADITIYNFVEAVNTVDVCLGVDSFALIGSYWDNNYDETPLALYTGSSLGGGSINPIKDPLGQYPYMCQ